MKLLVLIPAYNAEKTLSQLIDGIRLSLDNKLDYTILVVDDGSTDMTSNLVKNLKAELIQHEKNSGKGAALKTGFQYMVTHEFDLVATIDADLQHDPTALSGMIDYLQHHSLDFVIGVRQRDARMSWPRRISNSLTSWIISIRISIKIPDSQSGYRVIRNEIIKKLSLKTSRYETESELILKAARLDCKFGFYPISTIYADEKSYIRHFIDTWRFIKMFILTINKNY
ncbi:glycosyltransferase family 2 protein [bacterium]|nr:glycosyltransferase family 2 protein [bacterium]